MLLALLVVEIGRSLVLIRVACHAPAFLCFKALAQPDCLSVNVEDDNDGRSIHEEDHGALYGQLVELLPG